MIGQGTWFECHEDEMSYLERRPHMDDRQRDRDRPLAGCWKLSGFADQRLLGKNKNHRDARLRLLGEALVVSNLNPDTWISYSRRPEHYANPSRYRAVTLTRLRVPGAIDELAEAGLLESRKAKPGSRGWQSVFRLSHSAHEQFRIDGISIGHDPNEVIVLRDKDKKCIDYNDTAETLEMRSNLRAFNEAIVSGFIELSGRLIRTGEVLKVGKATIGPAINGLYRVFNLGKFDLGGRFYGGWWQGIPKERRNDITIGGRPTSEADYSALHPALLYAERGMPFDGDPYSASSAWDWDRKTVKTAFNISLNAESPKKAALATAYMLDEHEFGPQESRRVVHRSQKPHRWDPPSAHNLVRAKRLLADIQAQHEPIADRFYKADGRRLQFVDSQMAERVLAEMILKHGVVCLPIHDSFVVDATNGSLLLETMEKSRTIAFNELTGGSSWTGYSGIVPQYGETPSPALACLPCPGLHPKSPANDNGQIEANPAKAA